MNDGAATPKYCLKEFFTSLGRHAKRALQKSLAILKRDLITHAYHSLDNAVFPLLDDYSKVFGDDESAALGKVLFV